MWTGRCQILFSFLEFIFISILEVIFLKHKLEKAGKGKKCTLIRIATVKTIIDEREDAGLCDIFIIISESVIFFL